MRIFVRFFTVGLVLLLLHSCSLFISPEDSPAAASHGYVEGITPSDAEFHRNRSYLTVQANWPGPGGDKIWLARNLGSTELPANSIDERAATAGWYFQFNRKQGFYHTGTQLVGSGWNSNIDENSDWEPSNDPCRLLLGNKWRLPTVAELRAFYQASVDQGGMGEGNRTAAFNSTLRLHAAGELRPGGGALAGRGENGRYWAKDQFSEDRGESLTFGTDGSGTYASTKAFARPVRCVFD